MNFYWEYLQKDGKYKRREFCQWCIFDGIGDAKKYPELIFSADARTWSKFYRSDLLKSNHIKFPGHPFEDFPVNPIIVLSAHKICQVHRPLYHYDCIRTGNITTQNNNYAYIPQGLKELHDSLKERGWIEAYKTAFQKYAIRLCRGVINEECINENDLKRFDRFLNQYCVECMPIYQIKISYIGSFAGYQLISQNAFQSQINYVDIHAIPEGEDKKLYFGDDKEKLIVESDVILLDYFMQKTDSQGIINKISALLGKTQNQTKKIVFLELFFSEKMGTGAQNYTYYSNVDEIREKNRELENKYKEVKMFFGNKIRFISFKNIDNYSYLYTPYGCRPEYYNGKFYARAFELIGEMVLSERLN